MAGSIFTHIDHYIATVTFSHPQSNSFPSELLQKLIDTFDRLSEDEKVRVIVLQSEGEKTFCAGASFDELMAINDLESGKTFFSGFANLINSMRKCSKIIIGRVQGKSVLKYYTPEARSSRICPLLLLRRSHSPNQCPSRRKRKVST